MTKKLENLFLVSILILARRLRSCPIPASNIRRSFFDIFPVRSAPAAPAAPVRDSDEAAEPADPDADLSDSQATSKDLESSSLTYEASKDDGNAESSPRLQVNCQSSLTNVI